MDDGGEDHHGQYYRGGEEICAACKDMGFVSPKEKVFQPPYRRDQEEGAHHSIDDRRDSRHKLHEGAQDLADWRRGFQHKDSGQYAEGEGDGDGKGGACQGGEDHGQDAEGGFRAGGPPRGSEQEMCESDFPYGRDTGPNQVSGDAQHGGDSGDTAEGKEPVHQGIGQAVTFSRKR